MGEELGTEGPRVLSPCFLPDHIIAVIPHTHFVILNAVKNLEIGMIVSLLLPDPSTPLRFAQDDKHFHVRGY